MSAYLVTLCRFGPMCQGARKWLKAIGPPYDACTLSMAFDARHYEILRHYTLVLLVVSFGGWTAASDVLPDHRRLKFHTTELGRLVHVFDK